jgi:hypothetical protein
MEELLIWIVGTVVDKEFWQAELAYHAAGGESIEVL